MKMIQAKATEPIGRKVTHKRTPTLTERPAGVVKNGVAPETVTAEQEAHNKIVDSIRGKYAFVPGGSEEFAREKQREIEREDRPL